MTLVKFNNGHKNLSQPKFTDVFDSIFNDQFFGPAQFNKLPAVNIAETENQFHIELVVPGYKKEDFKINLDKNVLSVSTEKKEEGKEEGKKYFKREHTYTAFTRSFTLPETADQANIEAEYVDGILKLNIAKKEEAKVQAREIAVK
ncbi:Hsp20/alpha crystallin family protein [Mucilaginibacter koreensis]